MHVTHPVIRLRAEEFHRRAQKAGLTSDTDIAERLGMNRTTVWRVLDGSIAPGERFIAAVLAAFPRIRFAEVFEVITPGTVPGERDPQSGAA